MFTSPYRGVSHTNLNIKYEPPIASCLLECLKFRFSDVRHVSLCASGVLELVSQSVGNGEKVPVKVFTATSLQEKIQQTLIDNHIDPIAIGSLTHDIAKTIIDFSRPCFVQQVKKAKSILKKPSEL